MLRGRKIGQTRYTLQQFDGIWSPRRIELWRLAAGDVQASAVVEVLSAEFDRPEHQQELRPADTGIELGTAVRLMDRSPARTRYWDGRRLVTDGELRRR